MSKSKNKKVDLCVDRVVNYQDKVLWVSLVVVVVVMVKRVIDKKSETAAVSAGHSE
jgi:hypothetical protein